MFPSFVFVPGIGSAEYASKWVDPARLLELPHVVFENSESGRQVLNISANRNEGHLRAIFVGHLTSDKGFDLVLELIEGTHEFLIWDICGEGALKSDLMKLISKLPEKVVEYHGFLQQTELVEFYRNSDFLILPTKHDTYALVVDEAMSHGVIPIVSNRIGDINWRIQDRGIVIRDFSCETWVREIAGLVENQSRIRILAENCRNFMVERDGAFWSRHITQLF
jgi:glycosyltransferase involved in cell wall biosynthesis